MIKNIIFDWSGTLSDDFTPVCKAIALVFKVLGHEPISQDECRREFVLPYMLFWHKYFPDLTKEKQDALYLEAIHQVEEPTIYPGVVSVLEELRSCSISMIVISSHPHDKLITEAAYYGLQPFFQEINGSIHDKTVAIQDILQRNNFSSQETAYVGDMTHDIDAGKKAGVMTVALGWGYQPEEKLKQANPDHYISSITHLLELL